LAISGWLEAGKDGVVVDRNTWILERALGYRVVLWEVVPLDNVTDISDDIFRVEVKTSKAGNNSVGDASQGNGAGRSSSGSGSAGWCGESTSDADSSCEYRDDGVHCEEDSELDRANFA
jgi:hypothetical protein